MSNRVTGLEIYFKWETDDLYGIETIFTRGILW